MNNEKCANSSSEKGGAKCTSRAEIAHIFCAECFVATGGYLRHNPHRPASGIATIRKLQQETDQ